MNFDLAMIETGEGGDIQLLNNDLAVVNSIENMPYLAMFGGNPGFITKNIQESQAQAAQSFDYWGNNLLMPNNQSTQFNSLTEYLLNNTPLNSQGRILIQNAITNDLQFLFPSAKVTVTVSIISDDRIDVTIVINQTLSSEQVVTINFKKNSSGDFFIFDFNGDFLI